MTEHMFPAAGGTALAEAPAGMQAPEDDSVAGENRKKLLVVAVAAGLLVAVIAAYFLMKSGGSSNVATGVVPGAHHFVPGAAANKAAGTKTTGTKPVTLPRQVAAPEGRNPFKPLYVVPAASAGGSSTSTTTSTSPSGVTIASTPPKSSTSSSSSGSSSGSTSGGTSQAFHPVWIQLKSETTSTATFVVGYSNGKTLRTTQYTNVKSPAAGKSTVFASTFALLAIRNGEVTVRFGDGSPFNMDLNHNTVVVG